MSSLEFFFLMGVLKSFDVRIYAATGSIYCIIYSLVIKR